MAIVILNNRGKGLRQIDDGILKKCLECSNIYPVRNFFYKRFRFLAWRTYIRDKCKSCHTKEISINSSKWAKLHTDRVKEISKRFFKSESGKKAMLRGSIKYKINNPDKAKSHRAVYYAVKTGRLVRPSNCSKCFIECKPQAHHHNGYDLQNLLNVIWLCNKCHTFEHKEVCLGSII